MLPVISRLLSLLVCLAMSSAAQAGNNEPRPFVSGSLAKIVAERQGKPFVLALWSINCTHCPEELKVLGKLKAANPKFEVVLVAADAAEDAPHAAEMARAYGLASAPQWIFSDDVPERLRFEIDRTWHGELPRTYFYDRQHVVESVSGLVPKQRLEQWIKENAR